MGWLLDFILLLATAVGPELRSQPALPVLP